MGVDLNDVEVLRVGKFRGMNGQEAEFSLADLQDIANSPLPHDGSPAVIGHPKTDAPAYGWIKTLRLAGDRLIADFRDAEESFVQWLKEKRYTGRSLKLSKNSDGTWRVWHVGFLGAVPPAVDGLAPINLAEEAEDALVFEFSGEPESFIVLALRNIREVFLLKFDAETADQYLPLQLLEQISQAIQSEQLQEAYEDMQEAIEDATEESEEAPKMYAATSSAEMLEFAAHLEKLISVEGKVLPVEREGLISLASSLSNQPLELAGGDAIAPLKVLTRSLDRRNRLVPLQSAVPTEAPRSQKLKNVQELAAKATEYQLAQAAKGLDIDIAQATHHIYTTYGVEE